MSSTEPDVVTTSKNGPHTTENTMSKWRIISICAVFVSIQFAYTVEYSVTSPIMSVDFKFPSWTYGIIWTTGPIAGLLQPLIGRLTDRSLCRWGKRRPTLLVGIISSVIFLSVLLNINKFLIQLQGWPKYTIMFILMLCLNISFNAIQTPARSLVSDLIDTRDQEFATKTCAVLMNLSSSLTNLIGGFRFFTGAEYDTDIILFYVGIVVIPLFGFITLLSAKEVQNNEVIFNENPFSAICHKLKGFPKSLLSIAIAYFFSWAAYYPANSLLTDYFGTIFGNRGPESEYFDNYHEGQSFGMFVLSISNFIVFLICFIQVWVRKKIGLKLTYLFSQILLCVILSSLLLTKNEYVLLGCFSLFASTSLFFNSVPFEIVQNSTLQGDHGIYIGILNLFCILGQVCGNIVCTTLFGLIKSDLFSSTAISMASGCIFSLISAIFSCFIQKVDTNQTNTIDSTLLNDPQNINLYI